MIARLVPRLVLLTCVLGPAARADDKADAAFEALMAEARKDPDSVDYRKLRGAYVKSSGYAPYGVDNDADKKVRQAMTEGDIEGALKIMRGLLKEKPLDLDHNAFAAMLYNMAGDAEKERWHQHFTGGNLLAIVEGRDGSSFEQAYPVIDVAEEYFLLTVKGLDRDRQFLREHDGHRFDVLEVKKDGESAGKLFFNVDLPMEAMGKMLQPK